MDRIDWSSKESASSMVENMRKRIHVLLVDHHDPPIAMLEHFFLQVTTVKFASTALALLSQGKAKFDLVLENIHSPDACGYKLLQEALKIHLPVILLFEEDDIMLTKRALEVGALLCIKKPMTVEIARYFWQLVLWDKTRSTKRIIEDHYNMQNGVGEPNFIKANKHKRDENATSEESQNHKELKSEKSISSSSSSASASASDNHQDMVSLRTKVWTEWTQELHDKFMDAVRKLGEGRCYPKDILEMMNVPGLTRMQVASHLQKCRSGSWIPPNKRKAKTSSAVAAKRLLFHSRKKFGFMPSSSSSKQTHNHHINTPNHHYSENMDYSIQFPHLTTQFIEFPNMDSIIQSFCASEEEDVPISYNVPVMNNANVEKWENTSKNRDEDDDDDDNDGDGKTDELVVKTEGV